MTYPPNNDPYGQTPPPPQYGAPQQPYGAPPPGQYGGQPPYGAPGYGTAPAAAYASWIQRVGASIIDSLCLAPTYIVAFVVGLRTNSGGGVNFFFMIFLLLTAAIGGYNRWFLAGKTGQSWGKKVLGLRLVSEQTGQPIGAGGAFLRDLVHIVDGLICGIGYLFPLWDAKRQTLADKIVSTIVVN